MSHTPPDEPTAPSPQPLRDHALVLGLALLVRLATLSAVSDLPLYTAPDVDAQLYHEEALAIVSGGPASPVRMLLGTGYFYLLGGLYAVLGPGPLGFRLAQHALGLLGVACTFEAARRLLPRRSAWVAGVLAATSGPLAFFESTQLSDAPAAALVAALQLGLVHAATTPGAGRRARGLLPLGLGLLAGAAASLRPNLLVLLGPVALVLALRGPRARRAQAFAAAALGAALVLGPIALRHHLVAGESVLLTANGGLNLYLGNGPGATGSFRVPRELADARGPRAQFAAFQRAAEARSGRRLSLHEADVFWRREALSAARREPARVARLLGRKARLLVNGHEIWDVYHLGYLRTRDARLGLLPDARLLLPLGLFGALVVLARRGPRGAPAVLLVALAIGVPLVLVFVSARYRLPLVPPLAVLAAVGVESLWAARARPSRLALAAALGLSVLACLPMRSKRDGYADEAFKLGAGYHQQGRLPEAEASYRESLARAPGHLPARANLSVLLVHEGRIDEARASWAEVERRAAVAGDAALAARAAAARARLDGPR